MTSGRLTRVCCHLPVRSFKIFQFIAFCASVKRANCEFTSVPSVIVVVRKNVSVDDKWFFKLLVIETCPSRRSFEKC